eukprot:jgi/Hompol1/4968/HPOL_004084-RA
MTVTEIPGEHSFVSARSLAVRVTGDAIARVSVRNADNATSEVTVRFTSSSPTGAVPSIQHSSKGTPDASLSIAFGGSSLSSSPSRFLSWLPALGGNSSQGSQNNVDVTVFIPDRLQSAFDLTVSTPPLGFITFAEAFRSTFGNISLSIERSRALNNTVFGLGTLTNPTPNGIDIQVPLWAKSVSLSSGSLPITLQDVSASALNVDITSGRFASRGNITVAGAAKLQSSSGSVDINRLSADSFQADLTSGSFKSDTILSNQINVHVSSGSIRSQLLKAADNLSVTCTSGSTSIAGIEARAAKLSSSSGELGVQDALIGQSLKGNSSSGSVSFTSIKGNDAQVWIESMSGSLSVGSAQCKSFEATVTSGSGKFGPITASQRIDISSSSGSITAGDLHGGDVSVRASSGNTRLSNITAKDFQVKSTSGSVRISGKIDAQTQKLLSKNLIIGS